MSSRGRGFGQSPGRSVRPPAYTESAQLDPVFSSTALGHIILRTGLVPSPFSSRPLRIITPVESKCVEPMHAPLTILTSHTLPRLPLVTVDAETGSVGIGRDCGSRQGTIRSSVGFRSRGN